MIDQLITLILNESLWLASSMGLAFFSVGFLLYRTRAQVIPNQPRVLAAMTLFFGITIGAMALGHLLAVTIKTASGSLIGPTPLFFLIGIALALPSWCLVIHALKG